MKKKKQKEARDIIYGELYRKGIGKKRIVVLLLLLLVEWSRVNAWLHY